MKKLQAQRVLELEVQNRLSDKQKSGLDQRPELQQDKAVLLGIMTVSYTHLDVYKRQVQNSINTHKLA